MRGCMRAEKHNDLTFFTKEEPDRSLDSLQGFDNQLHGRGFYPLVLGERREVKLRV